MGDKGEGVIDGRDSGREPAQDRGHVLGIRIVWLEGGGVNSGKIAKTISGKKGIFIECTLCLEICSGNESIILVRALFSAFSDGVVLLRQEILEIVGCWDLG